MFTAQVLNGMLCIGESLLASGAEVARVEDTLRRMGTAYGAVRVDANVITTNIMLTMIFADGTELTRTRRIYGSGSTNFARLEALNELSRHVCREPMPGPELMHRALEIANEPASTRAMYIGSIGVAGAFSVFFGGGALDAAAACAFGALTRSVMSKVALIAPNAVIFNFICSFIVGMAIRSVCMAVNAAYPGLLNVDMILIGAIMLMIPGLAMTNSIRDLLAGDTIFGLMRFVETMLWAGALACGMMLSMVIL